VSRRGFFGVAAAGLAGVMLAPGIRLIEIAQAASGATPGATPGAASGASAKVRWGMLIDTTKCAPGCTDCVTACNTENGLGGGPDATRPQWIRKVEIKEIKTGRTASAPVMCQHCAEPPCVDVCPTGASFKRADGIVLVDRHSCIGCRYCVMACPYKARSFVHEEVTDQKPDVPRGKGCVEGCTLCVHRIDQGHKTTACAEACAKAGHGAILFGDLNDADSDISRRVREIQTTQLRADLKLDTGVRYHGI
jgi:molybdopterin-containing oxidoreductase family iron-sulfur binding subunit